MSQPGGPGGRHRPPLPSLLRRAAGWARHLGRITAGRPSWSAEREFAYYRVTPELVAGHRKTQESLEREAFLTGLLIARGLGVLDTRAVRGARVLDLGAGECSLAAALAGPLAAAEVWAVDAVPKQIWAAAERAAAGERGPGLRCLIADCRDLPFADASFDLIVANLVLHHIEPVAAVLAEVRRLLRPGGLFAALEPSPLVGALSHAETSENEAPIPPRRVLADLREEGFCAPATAPVWTRLGTAALGPLSPSYRVAATAPGQAAAPAPPVAFRPGRTPRGMRLPGLLLDPGCSFVAPAEEQEQEILAILS